MTSLRTTRSALPLSAPDARTRGRPAPTPTPMPVSVPGGSLLEQVYASCDSFRNLFSVQRLVDLEIPAGYSRRVYVWENYGTCLTQQSLWARVLAFVDPEFSPVHRAGRRLRQPLFPLSLFIEEMHLRIQDPGRQKLTGLGANENLQQVSLRMAFLVHEDDAAWMAREYGNLDEPNVEIRPWRHWVEPACVGCGYPLPETACRQDLSITCPTCNFALRNIHVARRIQALKNITLGLLLSHIDDETYHELFRPIYRCIEETGKPPLAEPWLMLYMHLLPTGGIRCRRHEVGPVVRSRWDKL